MKKIIYRFVIMVISTVTLTACFSDERSADGIAKTWVNAYENSNEIVERLSEGVLTMCGQMQTDDLPRFRTGFNLVRSEILRVHLFDGIAGNSLETPIIIMPLPEDFTASVEAYVEKSKSEGGKHKYLNPWYFDQRLVSMSAMEYLLFNEGELLFSDDQRCQAFMNIMDEFKVRFMPHVTLQNKSVYPWLLGFMREDKEDEMMATVFVKLDYLFEFSVKNLNAMQSGTMNLSSSAYQASILRDVSIALETINATYVQGKFFRYLSEMGQYELDQKLSKEFEVLFIKMTDEEAFAGLSEADKNLALEEYLNQVKALHVSYTEQVAPLVNEYLKSQR